MMDNWTGTPPTRWPVSVLLLNGRWQKPAILQEIQQRRKQQEEEYEKQFEELVNPYKNWEIAKLNLSVPNDERNTPDRLSYREIEEVNNQLTKQINCAEIRGVVEDVRKCEDPRVDKKEKKY